MAPKKAAKAEENVSLGPATREGEVVFGVAHIFASFNDTFVHVTGEVQTICVVHAMTPHSPSNQNFMLSARAFCGKECSI